MEKLNLHSPDFTQANIEKLAELYPNCVTETRAADGTLKKAIDFDLLKQELSTSIVEGPQERYQLNWPGKREALLTANAPIAKTLRPCRDESVDFDTTQNLYIEGDNLDALKLLQETYLGKVKMIYIDPPYNTGNDFIYNDRFTAEDEQYQKDSGLRDEEGNRLLHSEQFIRNQDTKGRFHSDWLSMMYSRLKLARNLLRDDGVIFISIDDNEQANLKRLCDEVFGEDNFISLNARVTNSAKNTSCFTSVTHDYTLIYCKNIDDLRKKTGSWKVPKANLNEFVTRIKRLKNDNLSNQDISKEIRSLVKYTRFYEFDHYYYVDNHFVEKGSYASDKPGPTKGNTGYMDYSLPHPNTGKQCKMPSTGWAMNKDKALQMLKEDRWHFGEDENTIPRPKAYLFEKSKSKITGLQFFDSQKDVKFLQKIGLSFDNPKPVEFICLFASLFDKNDIILDFFSGSATTAHAVMQLNAEDGGNRKFIMVQLPEVCDPKSEAYKAGYKTIVEIGKERIRRAGQKIKAELERLKDEKGGVLSSLIPHPSSLIPHPSSLIPQPSSLDIGFRVLKVDSSNMKDVYYTPDKLMQGDLEQFTDNIRDDITPEDLLFQVLLDWGVDLTLPITQETMAGFTVLFVDENALAACFDTDINETFIKALAARHPLRVVFRDASFANDSVKINIEQIFKLISPHTEIKTL